ncbi:MAG: biopolymer transporter ExbD [Gammaproteobacteria bacterium]|nr:biopolymer transporter ExbD [Gammaproteobacteria bacterium]
MRQRHSLKQKSATDVNMTPMIDMVFILLIFFIVSTSFVRETGIDINRPSANTAVQQSKGNILVAINERGEIWMENRRIDIRAVRANVERLHAENPDGAVVIQADKASATGSLILVMDQVRLAGVNNISVAAKRD